MNCKNFVCAFSQFEKGKVFCTWNNENKDCDVSRSLFCHNFKYLGCTHCGHDNVCFKQREKGVFYSPGEGEYVPSSTADFVKLAERNDLINAKLDIYNTAVNNFCAGYKKQTTVNQLYEKYRKTFPQFTKDYLINAVEKSILKYLQTE